MKKVSIFLSAIALLFVACDREEISEMEDSILANIEGLWIVEQMDGVDMPSSEIFVMEYDHQGVQGYGFRAVDGDNSTWSYTTCDYWVSGDKIYFESESLDLEIEVISISSSELEYRVISYFESDVDQQETNIYKGYKADKDYSTQIVGEWKGIDEQYIDDSNIVENQHIWIFNSDDTYIYKSYDAAANDWVAKDDNAGTYFVYGDLLIFEYSNSHLTNIDGKSCDIWEIDIDDDQNPITMEWEATATDGSQSKFYLDMQ